jgi:hypothetical protein
MTCTRCSAGFTVTDEDLAFLETVAPVFNGKMEALPAPDMCPRCRMQTRLARRNERSLYHRKCGLSGKQIISCYSTDKPFPVYDNEEWYSDKWDARTYGRDVDFSRPFFTQFRELQDTVPRMARILEKPYENSDYCNTCSQVKNCYLMFSSNQDEDCYFGSWVNQCASCVDNLNLERCELCYECVGCRDGYNLRYCRDSVGCRDSFFLRDCQGCRDCFGCTNQISKSFMVFNQQKTEAEYAAFLQKVGTGRWSEMRRAREQVEKLLSDPIVKETHGVNNERCSGDYLRNCRNARECFEGNNLEDCAYSQCLQRSKSSMDHSYWGQGSELVYFSQACGYEVYHVLFSNLCWSGASNLLYCDHSFSAKNCFGCTGLRKNEYCILNKQYTREEYEALVPRIIAHMRETGEWGCFFPPEMSIYAYNETLAQEHVPLTQEETLARGWQWKDEEDSADKYRGPVTELPDSIADAPEDITGKILQCEATGRHFKIIPQEIAYYRTRGIPVPRLHPDERHKRRMALRNPRILWDRACAKCSKPVRTTYAPDRPEIVYCEACYLSTVY